MKVHPWWGPEVDFGLIDLTRFRVSKDRPINFRLVWRTPEHRLYANDELVASQTTQALAKAAELGLSKYTLYNVARKAGLSWPSASPSGDRESSPASFNSSTGFSCSSC